MDTKCGLAGKVKNTFLDFDDDELESADSQRPNSDPTSDRSSCSDWSESDNSESSRCRIYKFRGEADLKKPVRLPTNMHGQELGGESKAKKKSTRPCKGKRERFRKYVDKVKLQLAKDPQGFTLHDVDFSSNLALDERGRKKVESILENYRTQVLMHDTESQPISGALACRVTQNPDIVSL